MQGGNGSVGLGDVAPTPPETVRCHKVLPEGSLENRRSHLGSSLESGGNTFPYTVAARHALRCQSVRPPTPCDVRLSYLDVVLPPWGGTGGESCEAGKTYENGERCRLASDLIYLRII